MMNFLRNLFCKKEKEVIIKEESHGQISAFELRKLLKEQKNFDGSKFYITDSKYKLTNIERMSKFLAKDKTSKQVFKKELLDCDNFSIQLHGQMNRHFLGFACGYIQSKIHAFNFFIDENKRFWIIEPQTDTIMKQSSDKYKLKMVLI